MISIIVFETLESLAKGIIAILYGLSDPLVISNSNSANIKFGIRNKISSFFMMLD
jgi:hypothetical protein